MGKKIITTIFWDLGNVLFPDVQISQTEFKQVRDLLGMNIKETDVIFARLWPDFVRLGKIEEDDYWQEYIKVSKNKPSVDQVKKLYRKCIILNNDLYGVAKELSRTYKQYVISNQGKEWMDYIIRKWELKNYFKDIFCSAYLGLAKPDLKIYTLALNRTVEKDPRRVLYIDDSAKNIKSASALGIRGVVYKEDKMLKKKLRVLKLI